MKKLITTITFLTLLTTFSFAASTHELAGTKAGQFLKIGVGARGPAMGGAQAAITRDINSIYWNPAGLSRLKNTQFSFMHCSWIEDIFYEQISFARKTYAGSYGFMINYLSMQGIEKISNKGVALNETYTPKDIALTFSYSKKISPKIPFGINLKYISSSIEEESASAFATDIGIQYAATKKFIFGAAVQNLGTKMAYISEKESLPLNIKLGSGFYQKLGKNLCIIALDINKPVDEKIKINFGAELNFKRSKNFAIAPRLGFRTDKGDLEEGSNSITAGFGMQYKKYDINYAFAPYGELGSAHRISIIFN